MLEPKTPEAEIFLDKASGGSAWGEVPSHTQDAIIDYLNREHPITRGSFLWAVLTNNLQLSVLKADHLNQARLTQIVSVLHWYMPSRCWGSEEAVEAFLENGKEG